jgi:hypothetical protein
LQLRVIALQKMRVGSLNVCQNRGQETFSPTRRLSFGMKTLILSLAVAASAVVPAKAQIFQPEIARDILAGSVVGAIIGDNNHHHALEGAVIGAIAGGLWGAATVTDSRPVCAQPVIMEAPLAPAACLAYQPAPVVIVQSTPVMCASAPVVYVGSPAVCYYPRGYWGWGYSHRWGRRR